MMYIVYQPSVASDNILMCGGKSLIHICQEHVWGTPDMHHQHVGDLYWLFSDK
jgi:hypothetical protein